MRTLVPLITAAVLAAALAGCNDGPSDSDTPTTARTPTTSPTSETDQPRLVESAGLELDAAGCPILPHGWGLCTDEYVSWAAYLGDNGDGYWLDNVDIGFFSDGTLIWRDFGTAAEGAGTWEYDGADTVTVRFDAAVSPLGTDRLSLQIDEFERGCGDPAVYGMWDALTAAQPTLRFEPIAC
ncbi:MAG: hypothetical protein FWH11_12880 [Micrococcales bacterium]|nr:hypothetical protein [Micrococcales bacterium]